MVLHTILVCANLFCVAGLLACTFSAWIKPQSFPGISYFGLAFPVFLFLTVAFLLFWLIVSVLHIRRTGWKCAGISLVGMICCAGSIRTYFPVNLSEEVPEGSLKVLSYNVFNKLKETGVPAEDNPVINYLLLSGADIICLQEANISAGSVEDKLIETVYPHRLYGTGGGQMALLSKLPILADGRIDYISRGSPSSRWYELLYDGDTILVINNHLESYQLNEADKAEYKEIIRQPEEANVRQNVDSLTSKLETANAIRGAQVDSVAAFIESHLHRPLIVCGDFNDCSISYTHRRLTRHLNDAYTRSGNGPGISYHRSGMYFRIDNILCSPSFRSYGAVVDRHIKQSDHYPIRCTLAKE